MKKQNLKITGALLISLLLFQGCMYDLSSKLIKRQGITIENTNKGEELLERAWRKQGYDKLEKHQVYSFHGSDTWRGVMGKMSQIWPSMKAEMEFKFQVGTFDGQVTFVNGEQSGDIAGIQNWNYYEIHNNDTLFKDKDARNNERQVLGLSAFQYFTEMISRIKNAPIISYAGEKEFRGKKYDLVFCTWGSEKPHNEDDQYIAWINKETGLMNFVQYTIREIYLRPPGYKMVGGGIEFADFRNIDGVMIPHDHLIYAIKLRKNQKNNLHRLILSDFEFDSFNVNDLRIDKNIKQGGDFKN